MISYSKDEENKTVSLDFIGKTGAIISVTFSPENPHSELFNRGGDGYDYWENQSFGHQLYAWWENSGVLASMKSVFPDDKPGWAIQLLVEMHPAVSGMNAYSIAKKGKDIYNNEQGAFGFGLAVLGVVPGLGLVDDAARGAKSFFQGAKYSPKVLRQMSKTDDIAHSFPLSIDGVASKYGKWSKRIGGDGEPYQWLEIEGRYGGKTGTFEFIKDSKGVINHRFFNFKK